ncbi:hypothetical protein NQ318_017380 [Aromia moschata]|uniref:NEDD4-binding protein 2 n=1 Tax=Aromia moschata TaxID=1265417 RepID=A0AAV8Z2E6_9CUCU|nr:hypothetical protein NQ318_017380 [Aromia moschata]
MATCIIEKHVEENVVHQLNELFGNVLHLDVIKRVAVSCHYDVVESSNKLLEITSFSDELTMEKRNAKPASRSVASPASKKSRKAVDIEKAINIIQKGYKVLVLIRGVPGCGKSHLSRHILQSTVGIDPNYKLHILSTDDYFYTNGVYKYNPEKISDAHGWNHNRAFNALSRGFSPVIIDNTNVQMWEMKPYAMMATDYGYIIEILEPDTHWCFNDKELAKRNTHGVPRSKIKEMLERYEKNITPVKLLNAYNLTYKLQKPPQWRLYPPLNMEKAVTSNHVEINTFRVGKTNTGRALHSVRSENVIVLNHGTPKFKSEPVETIDLMEFNDVETTTPGTSQPVIEIVDDEISVTSWSTNPVDNILMCNNDSSKTIDILQPTQNNMSDILLIDDSSDEDNQMVQMERKTFPDLETAWGINENALRSWDIVTPIKDEGDKEFVDSTQFPQQSEEHSIVTNDSSCNTEEIYFRILKSNSINPASSEIKIVDTVNRDINRSTPKKEPVVLKKPVLDKSCLTEDIFENYDNHMSQLLNLFPSIPKNHLKYWYNKCKGDLEWTIEFLLEAKEEITSLIEENEDNSDDNGEVSEQLDNESVQVNPDCSSPAVTTDEKELRNKRSFKSSDEHNEIKKIIESKIDINQEHYSKHLLKVKHFKFGYADSLQPSVSSETRLNATADSNYCTPKPSTSQDESWMVMTDDSDTEFEELEDVADKPEEKPEETTELNLGENLVAQLEEKIGDPNMCYPKGFQPVVQVPITLARQLYTFYIESVYQQMDNQKQVMESLTKEDEDFARKLQAKEEETVSEQMKTSNLREIMDEQVAQNIYQKEAEKWKDLDPDNLAARLTKQKLFSVFPDIDKNTLVEILYAHNNKYQDTVEILLASTGGENVNRNIANIKEPPLKEEIIQEMKEAQESSSNKEYDDQHAATFYREEANRYLKKRVDLYQKAQQYHQRGMTEVAQFYSGLASQQTMYFDRANNMAATAFLDEHSKRLQDFNTIDLHFLYTKEAIPALDVFLDLNINLLRHSKTKQSEHLQIITGRGKRSENGISKIRPVVMDRLKRRKIKFTQLNPGLLQAKITKNSLVTSEFLS